MQHRARGNVSEVVAIGLNVPTCWSPLVTGLCIIWNISAAGLCWQFVWQNSGHTSFSCKLPCWPMYSGFVFLTDDEVFNGIDVLRHACWTSPAVTNLPFHSTHLTQFLQQLIQPFSVPVLIRKLLNKFYCTVAIGFLQVFDQNLVFVAIPLLIHASWLTHSGRLWVRRPLWVNQLGQLSLPSLRGR